MNESKIGNKNIEKNTNIFVIIILLILMLQSGPLGNLPIVLILLPLFLFGKNYIIYFGKCEKCLLLYALYLVCITLLHINENYNISYTSNLFVQYIIIYVSLKLTMQKVDCLRVLIFIRNLGIVLSILCIPEALFRYHFFAELLGKEIYTSRVVSIFEHPILCGCFFVVVFSILIIYPLKKNTLQLFSLLVVLTAVVLTQSRSSWIAIVVICLFYIFKMRNYKINKNYFLYVAILLAILILIALVSGHNIFFEVYKYIYKRLATSLDAGEGHIVRIEIIINSWNAWINDIDAMLFGNGKNYGLLFMKENPVIKFGIYIQNYAIDNQYITLIHETGIVGLLLILSCVAIFIKRFIRASRENKEQIATCLCLIGNSICLFFFEGFNYPLLIMIYFILVFISDANVEKRDDYKYVT